MTKTMLPQVETELKEIDTEVHKENLEDDFSFNCYVLNVSGPPLKFKAETARKGSGRADYMGDYDGWAFEKQEDAQLIADERSKGSRVVNVFPTYFPILEELWSNNKKKEELWQQIINYIYQY